MFVFRFSFSAILIVSSLVFSAFALYEDEIGKFDWTRQFVGRVQHLEFDEPASGHHTDSSRMHQQQQGGYSASARRFFVATDHGLVAAIGLKSSRIVWRHFLEEAAPINDLKVCDGALFSLSSGLLRSWSVSLGTMEYELSVQETSAAGNFAGSLVCYQDPDSSDSLVFVSTPRKVYAVHPQRGSIEWAADLGADAETEVTSFYHPNGVTVVTFNPSAATANSLRVFRFADESSKPKVAFTVSADWLASLNRCAMSVSSLVCLDSAGSARLLATSGAPAAGVEFQQLSPTLLDQLGGGPWLSVVEIGAPDAYQLTGSVSGSVAMLNATLATAPTGERLPPDSLLRYRGRVRFLLRQPQQQQQQAATAGRDDAASMATPPVVMETSFSGTPNPPASVGIQLASHHGPVVALHPVTFSRRGVAGSASSGYGYRVVMATRDADLHAFDDAGERQWLREESLAGIVSAEAVDLPAADQDELVSQGGSVFASFAQRLSGQAHHLAALAASLASASSPAALSSPRRQSQSPSPKETPAGDDGGGDSPPSATPQTTGAALTRDEFNLRKLLVVATREGKLAGIDSATGRCVWRRMIPLAASPRSGGAEPLARGQMPLYIQRTTAHFPLEPLATVVFRDGATGLPCLFSFNPLTGAPAGQPVKLQYRLLQAVLVPTPSHDDGKYLRPLLLLSDTLQVAVHPPGARPPQHLPPPSGFKSVNVFTIDAASQLLQGYRIRLPDPPPSSTATPSPPATLAASPTWRLALHEQILATASRRPSEHVHSVGRVLGNRHVLYKYLNPNLLAVATQTKDVVTPAPQVGEAFTQITVWLVDTISGRVVASGTHQHSSGPVSLVHSEHWVVYSLWNQKQRRFQLSVWELFVSGLRDCMNASRPLVSRQAYILPAPLQQLAVSQTERGITAKAVLLALKSGGIMELNKAFLDPRRPFEMTAEFQEEGLVPYNPEVPMSTQAMVNYNQSLLRVVGMLTVPTGLESTSMLFVYGTDLFCTRVQPSKMFDVLKSDFDYLFIGAVTIGMVVGSFVTQKLAARKALFRLWS